jgi:tetratricopeptide (TPR) repeat protein
MGVAHVCAAVANRPARGAPRGREREALAFRGNKRKTLETAQKYVQKGSYDKALKEYEKLLQTDPSDTNVRLKIGDLYLKRKNPPKAIEAYSEVASIFAKQGFDAKAVAIYKQILRIAPDHLDARIRLGELYQRLGLTSESMREFEAAVKVCQERGMKREAFDLLKRVAQIDPGNVRNRIGLADQLVREGLEEEARGEYEAMLQEVERAGSAEMKARVCERLLASFPQHREALGCLAKAKIELGEAAEAVDLLVKALAALPDDVEIREALVTVYQETGDDASAQRVYREIAELYKKRGDHDRARDILQRYVPVEPFTEPDTPPSMALREMMKLPGSSPEPDGPAIASRPLPAPQASELSTPEDLLAEARISLEFDNPAEAELRARELLQIDPHSDGAKQVLARICVRNQDFAGAIRLHEERRSLAAATGDAELLASVEEELNEVRARSAQNVSGAPPHFMEESPSLPLLEEDEVPPDDEPLTGQSVQEVALESLPDIEIVLDDEYDTDDSYASIEPPSDAESAQQSQPVAHEADPRGPRPLQGMSGAGVSPGPEPAPPRARGTTAPASSTSTFQADSTYVAEALKEAENHYRQGVLDRAEPLYRAVLERAPQHPQALVRLGEIAAARGDSPEQAAGGAAPAALEETAPAAAPGGLSGAPETLLETSPGAPEPVQRPTAAPSPQPEPWIAEPEPVQRPTAAPSPQPEPWIAEPEPVQRPAAAPSDESAEPEHTPSGSIHLEQVLGSESPEPGASPEPLAPQPTVPEPISAPAPSEPPMREQAATQPPQGDSAASQTTAPIGEPGEGAGLDLIDPSEWAKELEEEKTDGGDYDLAAELAADLDEGAEGEGESDFDAVLGAFKRGIQGQLGEEDCDARYDLAIAYREMGLLEDAVAELEIASRGGSRQLEALAVLATTKIELDRADEAIEHIWSALRVAGHESEMAVALRYDLGVAFLAKGEKEPALRAFKMVAQRDVNFRDVAERIAELEPVV